VSIDLQTVFPQESITLSQVRVAPGPPRTVSVVGQDFRAVETVLINQVGSPDVVVVSKNTLIAQVPSSVVNDRITSVSVLSTRLTLSARSLLKIRIGQTPGRVSGILRLLQLFIKVLFTTPGRDIFSPRLGGGGLRNVGSTYGAGQGQAIVNDFIISVDTTSKQIIAMQGRSSAIPRDERLLSAQVLSATFDKSLGGINAAVRISSQAGQTGVANVEL